MIFSFLRNLFKRKPRNPNVFTEKERREIERRIWELRIINGIPEEALGGDAALADECLRVGRGIKGANYWAKQCVNVWVDMNGSRAHGRLD